MKSFKQLRNELSKLHNEIAMKDVKTIDQEDELDIACGYICKALKSLELIDNGN